MPKWTTVIIGRKNIEKQIENSYLIHMPQSSKYAGYMVWLPAKLVKAGRNIQTIAFSFTNEFIFKLKRYDQEEFSDFHLIDVKDINALEFEKAFVVNPQEIDI